MSTGLFIALFVGIQLGLIALDLYERYRTRTRYGDQRLGVAPVLFLAGVAALFFVIQMALMSLVPRVDVLMADVANHVASWTGRPLHAAPISGWPLAVVCLGVFYLGGLVDYAVHRFFSHSRPFWWTHEYHHLPKEVFVALPGLSTRPFSVFTAFPTALASILIAWGIVLLFGWPLHNLEPLRIVVLANTFILTTSHSEFLRRWWWPHELLRRAGLATPHEHLIHHTVDRPGNYGNIVTLWDRLFGTYRDPRDPENQGRPLGLDYDQDFLGTLTFGRVKLSERWRRRFFLHRYCNLHQNTPSVASDGTIDP